MIRNESNSRFSTQGMKFNTNVTKTPEFTPNGPSAQAAEKARQREQQEALATQMGNNGQDPVVSVAGVSDPASSNVAKDDKFEPQPMKFEPGRDWANNRKGPAQV